MPNPLTQRLARLFKDRAELTSLKQLKKEGFKHVHVLDAGRLEDLVLQAIERVMTEASAEPGVGRRLARNAQAEFLRLLGDKSSLERATDSLRREQRTLEFQLEQVQKSLAAARTDLDESVRRHNRDAMVELSGHLEQVLKDVFGRSLQEYGADSEVVAPALTAARAPLREALMGLLSQALQRAQPTEQAEASENEIDLLQRRIRKLTSSLSEAEEMMVRLREQRDQDADGVASVYRSAQGLSGKEHDYQQRRKLLAEVFRLNLELRKDSYDPKPSPDGPEVEAR